MPRAQSPRRPWCAPPRAAIAPAPRRGGAYRCAFQWRGFCRRPRAAGRRRGWRGSGGATLPPSRWRRFQGRCRSCESAGFARRGKWCAPPAASAVRERPAARRENRRALQCARAQHRAARKNRRAGAATRRVPRQARIPRPDNRGRAASGGHRAASGRCRSAGPPPESATRRAARRRAPRRAGAAPDAQNFQTSPTRGPTMKSSFKS